MLQNEKYTPKPVPPPKSSSSSSNKAKQSSPQQEPRRLLPADPPSPQVKATPPPVVSPKPQAAAVPVLAPKPQFYFGQMASDEGEGGGVKPEKPLTAIEKVKRNEALTHPNKAGDNNKKANAAAAVEPPKARLFF